ncbi:MAG: hypothetical protein JWQ90_4602 [Hydrocarboniphaga sp.]|uniref:DUF4124 domain-containing protein n=1 Tax=Hydrocarboniphaga sp. TaxID=2033016 RepID=UPI00261CF28D|nr:DUF4124 domain-containing protein [Hydrocarboniphaga sp.]MDB5972152.1 hypothetical protein [Hydrocarboniphaga sp.]
MNRRRIALLLLWIAALPVVTDAAVYKWTDSQGALHYDDMNQASGHAMTQDDVKKRVVKAVPEWAGIVPAEFAHEVEQRCAQTRERLAGYRSAKTLYGRDPDGNTYRLSASQARLLVAETERETTGLCAADAPQRLYQQVRPKSATN